MTQAYSDRGTNNKKRTGNTTSYLPPLLAAGVAVAATPILATQVPDIKDFIEMMANKSGLPEIAVIVTITAVVAILCAAIAHLVNSLFNKPATKEASDLTKDLGQLNKTLEESMPTNSEEAAVLTALGVR